MKSWITTLLIGVSLCLGSSAQADSNRTIRLVVPFDAGGPADLVARILAERLGPALGGTVIVENRRGANGMIAMGQVARAKPDGSTLVFATSGMLTISPVLYRSLPYSPLRDFVPVSRVVVNCSGPITSTARPDYIGHFGTTFTENIGSLWPTLSENEPTLVENRLITSASTHIS